MLVDDVLELEELVDVDVVILFDVLVEVVLLLDVVVVSLLGCRCRTAAR